MLFGVPIGVKDIFLTDGFPTRAGSRLPESLFTGKESSAVSLLKDAGALILGKTVTTEFAYFQPGPTSNPHDPSRTPGGSSSGSAAAVACGYTPLALGTQTIGSVTRPASFCGVYGYKPSFQRIDTDGIIPFSESADHVGFFTHDMAGIELTASILCKRWSPLIRLPEKKPVIGVVTGSYLEQADDEMIQFFETQIRQLERHGCKIIRTDIFGNIGKINAAHQDMIASDFAEVHKSWFISHEKLYSTYASELIKKGRSVSREVFDKARQGRITLREKNGRNKIKARN